MENTLRKSDRKFIRTEKARIRRQFLDFKKQEEMISQLYERFSKKQTLNKEAKTIDDKSVKSQLPITNSQSKTKIEKVKVKKENKKEYSKKDKIKAKK